MPYSAVRTGVLGLLAIVAIAVSLAAVALATWAIVARGTRMRFERRLVAAARELDELMRAISERLARAMERLLEIRSESGAGFGWSLNLDEVLHGLATEAAARTHAQASAVRISGPKETITVASHGGGSRRPPS